MEKVQVRAVVTLVETGIYPRKDDYAVSLDCGQPFKRIVHPYHRDATLSAVASAAAEGLSPFRAKDPSKASKH